MVFVEVNGMKAEVSVDEFKQLMKGTRGAKNKKSSINGAPLDIEPEVLAQEKDGAAVLVFKHKDYSKGIGGYAVADIRAAKFLVEAQQFADQNRRTGTRFVRLENGRTIGENLVLWAEKKNLL